MAHPLLRRIERARERLRDVAVCTPVTSAPLLSARLGHEVLLKREDLQPVFSFKLRGAYNKIAGLGPARRARGVIAASAGNHAQGVAYAAARHRVAARIVMPRTTPSIKVAAVRARRARVVLHGDSYDEAAAHALQLQAQEKSVFIPPYDDPEIIAGQGTVAAEIDEQCPGELGAVFIPVGGGGLAAGMVAWLRCRRPRTRVYGVEPEDAACLARALQSGRRVRLSQVGLFAEGAAVAQIGRAPFTVFKEFALDGVITVSIDEICAAIKDIFEDTRSIAEPAGALALAGLKKYAQARCRRRMSLLAVHSGANINFDRLRHIAERTEVGERREAVFSVQIPERPGSFHAFCRRLGKRSITECNYRWAPGDRAQFFLGIAVSPERDERAEVYASLRAAGYPVHDMTDNDLAKLHIRHMVGGRTPGVLRDERLYRVQFPERPGALLNFLGRLGTRWNISLFHYRSHGAAYGRVLVGVQVPRPQKQGFEKILDEIGFPYREETQNRAYRDFLR